MESGRIASIKEAPSASVEAVLAMPPLVNAHDHGRAVRTSALGAFGKPLEIWLHHLALFPAVDPYLAAAVSLGKSALGGAGTVMVHYTRVQGLTDLPTEVAEVARAARDVGVRVGFAVAMRDRNPLVYGPSQPILAALPKAERTEVEKRLIYEPMPVSDQLALVEAAAATASETFDVQYGPQGVQWCSRELLCGIAEASASTGRRVHMHLLETHYQRRWADEEFPAGIVRFLDEIELLSPRLSLAHCTWARPDELELLAARDVTIAVNTSSNLTLKSGIAPLAQMLRCGCRVAMGLDALALDDDDDALRELRLTQRVHAGSGFTTDVDRAAMLRMALHNGRRSVLNNDEGGELAADGPADVLLLDWETLHDDRVRSDLDPLDILFARATAHHIRELIVAARTVVRDGRVLGIDLPTMRNEVIGRMRAGFAQKHALVAALPALEIAIANHFEPEPPCC